MLQNFQARLMFQIWVTSIFFYMFQGRENNGFLKEAHRY